MAITIRTATPDDWEQMVHVDGRDFGFAWEEWRSEAAQPYIEPQLHRFLLAIDAGQIVGVTGAYDLEVTLPGLASLPMAGTTWVSVAATHRRQGLLRRLITRLHDDIDERGEPLASLYASEGGIYERFGYGMASQLRLTSIDTRRARLRPEVLAEVEPVRFLTDATAATHVAEVWERFWRSRPGEVRRNAAQHAMQMLYDARAEDGSTPVYYVAHADGLAAYRIKPRWNDGQPNSLVNLEAMWSLTPVAHASLWNHVLGIDLVGEVTSRFVPLDDPLPYWLADGRRLRTTTVNDGIWVNVRDVRRCFSTRTYATDDRLVVEADGVRWAIDGSPAGAAVRKVRSKADLVTDRATLGVLLYGGVRPSVLARGRRLESRSADVLRRADHFFLGDVLPYCHTSY